MMNAEQAKFLIEYFANMMAEESKATAKVIAAVPDSGHGYKPDEKSRSAWELATHLAIGDVWFLDSILNGSFAFDPEVEKKLAAKFTNAKDLAEFYTREYNARLQKLRQMPAEKLTAIVDFFGMFQWPNAAYIGFANNHSTHHRGQLASYLRAMGSKVPAIYGGSADEPMMAAS
jgi:uncharacterized damage-inducible protein DinB